MFALRSLLGQADIRWREREKAEMKLICAFCAALTALLGSHDGFAQPVYPDKAIRILVGFPPGGPPDIAARLLADKFTETWGKPVLVENATGAGGNVAVDRAAKAAPDGYTLVIGIWSTHVVNAAIYTLQYDVLNDFEPVALLTNNSSLIVAKKTMPAHDLKSLIAWLKANPDKVSAGTAGVGSPQHVFAPVCPLAAL
jgi:tripartite-type tricarboxylate transporter receptor subunit TctC